MAMKWKEEQEPVEASEETHASSETGVAAECLHPKDKLVRVHSLAEVRANRALGSKYKCGDCGKEVSWTSDGVKSL